MKAIITVRNGIVENVFSDNPDLEILVSYDNDLGNVDHEDEEQKTPEGMAAVYEGAIPPGAF